MAKRYSAFLKLLLAWFAAVAFTPLRNQTVEQVCRDPAGRMDDARVRVAWTPVASAYDDVLVTYCIMRGEPTAHLAFERNAEIVYFALSTTQRKADRRAFTFVVRTSAGRLIRQGPALLQPLAKDPISCRVDVCQFFTEPGERVVSVAVEPRRK